jgi:tetratricopeptide (TPR) repeat protein
MESILDNLCKIKDLRVISRTSVEQYRNNPKPIPEIAEEMNVSYILEGSGLKDGDDIRLTVQLIDATHDRHIWSGTFDRKSEEIFALQSEVARLVAKEIQAIITPDENELIGKIPTHSQTAYEFYQKGNEELRTYSLGDPEALARAEDLFQYALEYDSSFAQAYVGMAWVYRHKHLWETYFSENFLDSVRIFADMALSYDDQLSQAYTVKGRYYLDKGQNELAIREYDQAIRLNPNDWRAYAGKGMLHSYNDLVQWLENMHMAASLNHGPELPYILRDLAWAYYCAGFYEEFRQYTEETCGIDGDYTEYYGRLGVAECWRSNFEKAFVHMEKAYSIDSTVDFVNERFGEICIYVGRDAKALKHYQKFAESLQERGEIPTNTAHRFGYVFWKNGYTVEAESYFKDQLRYGREMIELGRSLSEESWAYYDLAGTYAMLGERDKAFENLRIFNHRERMPFWMVHFIRHDPLFGSIRQEPEYQQIARDNEGKYQAEHERVRKWLEENDML